MKSGALNRRGFLTAATTGLSALKSTGRTFAQDRPTEKYIPTWDSLDSHPCPAWFTDAKLGMYFHWGLSSVPGWAPRQGGTPYAEWYWHSMRSPENPTSRYHVETYGDGFEYDDFIPMFSGRDYDPETWISFAVRAGMKYVFMNAKHHDGFCNWPSRATNRHVAAMGPCRDIAGPFVAAARSAGLKVGFYYSLYEWYNPLYTGKPEQYTGLIKIDDYVNDFMLVQLRELIDMYSPDFLYLDGEWDQPPEFWRTRELVAYYYNRALDRGQDVLVNDRYGKGSRGLHGDVYNVEYQYDNESEGLLDHPWSYWRGVARTFGWNRDTAPSDCLTARELIHMVVDGAARNGNYDLNIGPDADGNITRVEREPVEELGRWLAVNGEAIYGTRIHSKQADENIRFTARDGWVYAIFLTWPGDMFRLQGVRAAQGSQITMLGIPGNLDWRQEGETLTVNFPVHRSRPTHIAHAWTLKIRQT